MKTHRLVYLLTITTACAIAPLHTRADEASALSLLKSASTSLHEKAKACDELGRLGSAKAVPVLAKLLADEHLHDYARDGLERIPDASAGKALIDALQTLKGNLRVGAIISLGDRREKAAVPALVKIARGKSEQAPATGAALSALAQVATDDATQAILSVLKKGEGEAKRAAARAALVAAQRMEQAGSSNAAQKVRNAVAKADLPAYIKQAASR